MANLWFNALVPMTKKKYMEHKTKINFYLHWDYNLQLISSFCSDFYKFCTIESKHMDI